MSTAELTAVRRFLRPRAQGHDSPAGAQRGAGVSEPSGPAARIDDADLVVNAMGPEMSPRRSSDPLLRSLSEAGWIEEDDLALGLKVAGQGACIGRDGVASKQLFYLGPMLRADYWEATAAAELRDHAERLARFLLANRDD